jgi:hypothetical protein
MGFPAGWRRSGGGGGAAVEAAIKARVARPLAQRGSFPDLSRCGSQPNQIHAKMGCKFPRVVTQTAHEANPREQNVWA